MLKYFQKCLPALGTLLLVLCLALTAFAEEPKHKVVIDAAHGGEDAGVVGIDKVKEKDLTLAIARAMQKELAGARGIEVVLIRDADKTVSMDERKKKIAELKPALVLSLHINGGFGKTASGFELYYPGFKNVDATDRKAAKGAKTDNAVVDNKHLNNTVKLARLVQRNLDNLFPRKGRGLREAVVPLADGLQVPVLTVELGFMTHPEEMKKLDSAKMQQAIAKALAKSIVAYF